jgi:Protein of unknown function (DUF3054)
MSWNTRRNAWPIAIVADALAVIVFATVGRASHDKAISVAGVWHTAWPFALGTAIALGITAATKADPRTLAVGVRVWLWTLVLGMVGRRALGDGTAAQFIVVATIVLAVLFLGWRFALSWQRWTSRWRRVKP